TLDAVKSRERPSYTAAINAHYELGPWGLQLLQRYYHETQFNTSWQEGVDVDDNSISSQSVSSIGLSYGSDLAQGGTWRLNFTVLNVFDREPPIVPGQELVNDH